ncbi:cathecol O-methyltransferase 1-like [Bidens hawaiensis]|uniref:cathecol O-methyltransferase 1-like n=1 Tax=Bidens hawaiensis TaxID=980011 RepID=UPI00404933B0
MLGVTLDPTGYPSLFLMGSGYPIIGGVDFVGLRRRVYGGFTAADLLMDIQQSIRWVYGGGGGGGENWGCGFRGYALEDAVVKGGVPFDKVYGVRTFEYPAVDARFNEVFNKAMVNHTTLIMKEILKHYHGFDAHKCVVDVGGGLGITLAIDHVGGDMFKEVPKGDAIFMKNCYKALPDNGKVIVVEAILPFIPNTSSSFKAIAHLDAFMMTQLPGGKERTEDEFRALAKGAGFTGIRKKCFVCNFWVIEFYK